MPAWRLCSHGGHGLGKLLGNLLDLAPVEEKAQAARTMFSPRISGRLERQCLAAFHKGAHSCICQIHTAVPCDVSLNLLTLGRRPTYRDCHDKTFGWLAGCRLASCLASWHCKHCKMPVAFGCAILASFSQLLLSTRSDMPHNLD